MSIGVLVINLGTPNAPESAAVRRYLKQFLSDRRVVEISPLVWQPILRGAVLTTRPRKSAKAYREVWSEQGSPLLTVTRAQTKALQLALGANIVVDCAMRYGDPAIAPTLEAMIAKGCDRILAVPLYPQYCAATTATAIDSVFAVLSKMRSQPAMRTLPPYYDDPLYIDALVESIARSLADLPFKPRAILASFHGMPERTRMLGDPYYAHCVETARLLAERLLIPTTFSFQSRFGPAKWLGPATDESLAALGREDVRDVAVVAPGFSADCLETLEELALRGRKQFLKAGGKRFAYLPCLNASAPGMTMLEALVRRELSGWITGSA